MSPVPKKRKPARNEGGFALFFIIALCLGMITVALLHADSVSLEYRAAGNAEAGYEARQAIEGARRYIGFVLANAEEPGYMPAVDTYKTERAPVGEAAFWILGQDADDPRASTPVYGLVDEASKLNLNTATLEMLEAIPNITAEFAAAIVDWRDADTEVTPGGAESSNYLLLSPPYRCKDEPFESVGELRLVYGADLELLYREDTNQNNILDPNEDDGDATPPSDNADGILDRGVLNYVTVYSAESSKDSEGNDRTNINGQDVQALQEALGASAQQVLGVLGALGPGQRNFRGLLEFYYASGLSEDDFAAVQDRLATTDGDTDLGRVNVNTAPEEVLACIPGIGVDKASQLVAQRQSLSSGQLQSIAWVASIVDAATAALASPYITTRSSQFSADIVAVGRHGRGFQRERFIFDTRGTEPVVVARFDLAREGWPLGDEPRRATTERFLQ